MTLPRIYLFKFTNGSIFLVKYQGAYLYPKLSDQAFTEASEVVRNLQAQYPVCHSWFMSEKSIPFPRMELGALIKEISTDDVSA